MTWRKRVGRSRSASIKKVASSMRRSVVGSSMERYGIIGKKCSEAEVGPEG